MAKPATAGWVTHLPLAVGAVGLALLVYFDLGPPLAFNDDWMYTWSVRQLGSGHGLRLFPEASPTALVQIFWGAVANLGRADPRVLRLSLLPFLVVGGYASYRLARDLGADRFWSRVAGVALVGMPVFMGVATGFMTDGFYIGLLLAAAAAAARWVRSGRGIPLVFALTVLAVLQRQHGAAIPFALAAGLLSARSTRRVAGREWAWLAVLGVAVLMVLGLPFVGGFATPNMKPGGGGATAANPYRLAAGLIYLPIAGGFLLVPFLVGLIADGRERRPGPWFIVAGAWVALAVILAGSFSDNNYWSPAGLNPVTIGGTKPALFEWVIRPVATLGLVAFLALFLRRTSPTARPDATFLLVLAAAHLLPLVQLGLFDRYYLPALALLVPLVAAAATRARFPRLAAGWAVAAMVAGLGLYAVGEQDYQAWQAARDRAARQAFATTDPSRVDGGYEVYAVYVEMPAYEATGRLPAGVGQFNQPSLVGPSHPLVVLLLTTPDDPRTGVTYQSLAPGKVVVAPR